MAREQATALRLQVHQGRDPAAERRASVTGSADTPTGLTFATLASRYSRNTPRRKTNLGFRASDWFAETSCPIGQTVTPPPLPEPTCEPSLAKIDAPELHNQVLACTSAIFSWAIRQEILTNNPCRGVERHAVSSRERVLSDAEVPLFWRAFGSVGIAGTALQMLLLPGQRPGEVAHMRHEHIFQMAGGPCPVSPTLPRDGPERKTRRHTASISLPVCSSIIAELGAGDNSGFVFGKVLPLDAAMRDICKAT